MREAASKVGPASEEWRRGWPIVAGSMLGMSSGTAMFTYTSGFFVKPLSAELGWSRGEIAISAVPLLLTALLLPLATILESRRGARFLVALGTAVFTCGYAAFAMMTGRYWEYLVILAAIGLVGGPVTAPFVFSRPIVAAFDRSRGLALAVAMCGVPLLSLGVLPALQHVISGYGWRAGYAFMVPVTAAVGLLSLVLLARNPLDRSIPPHSKPAVAPGAGSSLAETSKDCRFWLLGVAMIMAGLTAGAFFALLVPLLSDRGLPGGVAALLGVWQTIAIVLGRISFGRLLDLVSPPAVASVALGAPAVGLTLLGAAGDNLALLLLGIACVAVAIGAEGEILGFFVSRYFGLRSFPLVFGGLGAMYGLSLAAGGVIAGYSFDRFAGYDFVIVATALLSLLAAVAMLASGRGARPGLSAA